MNYNDYNKAITAEDLIRRYNLENLSSDRKNIKETKKELEKVNHTTNQFVESVLKSIEELQDQVDGNITTWFFSEVPTLENYPASDWTTDEEKNNHLGDLYYDNSTGYAYRFALENEEYKWIKIVDSDVVEALAIANAAQDTADKKRQVFVVTPTPPYEVGDIWIKDDKDIYRCKAKRSEGEYSNADWIKASDYTNDDYAKNVEAVLNQFKTTVESDYVTKVLLETTADSINASVEAITTKTEILENELTGKSDVKNVEELTQRVDTVQTATSQNTTAVEELKVNDEVQSQKITEFEITVDEVTSTVAEQNDKISKVTQTVDELNSKISDIAEISVSKETNTRNLEFESINQSEPIRIVIRPIGEHISYLYPNSNMWPTNEYQSATEGLVPSETLTPSNSLVPSTKRNAQNIIYLKDRKLRFHNKTKDENFDITLPGDLLYYDSENYDEFILDYAGLSCVINKKVGYNADGSVHLLENPSTIEYDYIHTELTDGDYEVSLLGYDNAYLFVRLMAQNIYTTQFATKAELNSEISQTSQEINLSVDKKLSNYSTTSEMNAQIQLSASNINQSVTAQLDNQDKELRAELELKVNEKDLISEINASADVINLKSNRFVVESDNFSLTATGDMTSNSGFIGGWSITKNGLNNGVVKLNSDGSSTIYTVADLIIIRNYIMGIDGFNLPSQMIRHYDLNNDGVVNAQDYVILQNLIGISMS